MRFMACENLLHSIYDIINYFTLALTFPSYLSIASGLYIVVTSYIIGISWHVHPPKTQISLLIRIVWSALSIWWTLFE